MFCRWIWQPSIFDTGWRRRIGCLVFVSHVPQKSPIISGFFAERDLQLKASYAFSPCCIMHCSLWVGDWIFGPVTCARFIYRSCHESSAEQVLQNTFAKNTGSAEYVCKKYVWKIPLSMLHPWNPPNPETQIAWHKFKSDQNMNYREILRNLSFSRVFISYAKSPISIKRALYLSKVPYILSKMTYIWNTDTLYSALARSFMGALYSIKRALYSIKRALYSIKRALYSIKFVLYSIKNDLYLKYRHSLQCTCMLIYGCPNLLTEPCIPLKEPYILSKEPYILSKDP